MTYTWKYQDTRLLLGSQTLIMGIVNVTPDSFSDGGECIQIKDAINRALLLQEQGADIIDIGGESTRPGAKPITVAQELQRVIPVIEELVTKLTIPISIDTYKADVAQRALTAGARIVNDISGMDFDPDMRRIVRQFGAGVVIMHIKGMPRNMQKNPFYENVIKEIKDYFVSCLSKAKAAGIAMEQIVLDPGIGFGKRLEDNFEIIRHLSAFSSLNRPILIGPSRKSFIGAKLDLSVHDRLEGTLAAVTASILNGAHIIRVHDVLANKRAAIITDHIKGHVKEKNG